MAEIGESSSSNGGILKPVIVRVKRKSFQSPLDAFWLEINERPLKRPLVDFEKLSISDSVEKENLKSKKVLVQHVETVSSSKASIDVLQSKVLIFDNATDFRTKVEERRHTFKQENKQDQLLSRAREKHEDMAKNARFEQIWKRRKGKKDLIEDESIHDFCHLYDVVRVDVEEETSKNVEQPGDTSLEDSEILCNYLPLIREFLPDVAQGIQFDIQSYLSNQATDDYVYDLYAVKDELKTTDEDVLNTYPLVQVGDDDDDFCDGPMESEWESDSNAEDNPMNDYPDEETSEEEEEEEEEDTNEEEEDDDDDESKTSFDDFEELDAKREIKMLYIHSEDEYALDDEDEDTLADDEDNWRWEYR